MTPIQGKKDGNQEQDRIFAEFEKRFEAIEAVLGEYSGVAIRIDREQPLDEIVGRIKKEIRAAKFIIADLTDKRPSCYFEAGFAEGLSKPIIYICSEQSVLKPGVSTTIHFDIHMNVQRFSNHRELKEKLKNVIEKTRQSYLKKMTTRKMKRS